IDGLTAVAVAGYSLGGNVALKLAAEYGHHAPRELVAVAAVSPIIEIAECVRALERRDNALYQWNFVKDLKRRIRRKDRLRPGTGPRIRSSNSWSDARRTTGMGRTEVLRYDCHGQRRLLQV